MPEKIIIRDRRNDGWFYLDDEYLNGYAKLCGIHATGVYLSLCRHANKEQTCFPSKKLIAEELSISERSVYRALEILEEWNIILRESQGRKKDGSFKNTLYTLLDKSIWKPKPSANRSVGSPSANDDIHRLPVVPNKDTHKNKDTHIATPSVIAPFSFKKYLEAMHNHKNRHVQIIAFYFQEKNISFESKGQVETAIRRHLRAAKQLVPFSDLQIVTASREAAKEYPAWTIETLIKILSR